MSARSAISTAVDLPSPCPAWDWMRIIPKLGQSLAQAIPRRNFVKVGKGQRILGGNPGAGLGRIDIFQPAIRIGDPCAVVVVVLFGGACGRVGERVGEPGHDLIYNITNVAYYVRAFRRACAPAATRRRSTAPSHSRQG